jgi:hypothetical protein
MVPSALSARGVDRAPGKYPDEFRERAMRLTNDQIEGSFFSMIEQQDYYRTTSTSEALVWAGQSLH